MKVTTATATAMATETTAATTATTAAAAPAATSGLFDRSRLVNYFDTIFRNTYALVSVRDIHGFF